MMSVSSSIDRKSVISRHNVALNGLDTANPLSVGNGRFAFTTDATGLQTFPAEYTFFGGAWRMLLSGQAGSCNTSALVTMSEWGWHSTPNPKQYRLEDTFVDLGEDGRQSPYPINIGCEAATWLRANPQQINLVRVGFSLGNDSAQPIEPGDIKDAHQTLDVWNGLLESSFSIEGNEVHVETLCLPDSDTVVVDIESALIRSGQLKISFRFPYAIGVWGGDPGEWSAEHDAAHSSQVRCCSPLDAVIDRTMDDLAYECRLTYSRGAVLRQTAPHTYGLAPDAGDTHFRFAFTLRQRYAAAVSPVNLETARSACAAHWNRYWKSGGIIDLSSSRDPRWRELERRIVLSQYLLAIQQAQCLPAGVSGLSGVSWHSIHAECAGFDYRAQHHWNRHEALERTLQSFFLMLPAARAIAGQQGYRGARWPFKFGADFEENPSRISPLLVWHIPNVIYGCEALYEKSPTRETLDKYRELVFETAEFMASFPRWDSKQECYDLGPPILSAREFMVDHYSRTKNPIFDLANWQWGLETANRWRRRLGLGDSPEWKRVAENLAPLPVSNGIYIEQERPVIADNSGHPMMLGCLGMLPSMACVDEERMKKTLHFVRDHWGYLWAWDYPMMAMTATRLHERKTAVETMLTENDYHRIKKNGHYDLVPTPCMNSLYLAAAALMAAGWEDSGNAPGFPQDGDAWVVRHEGLVTYPA
jgi:hypothetical protein